MEIKQISIDKLKPDKSQPRQIFNEKEISGLAKSIQSEGVINPIEIDENNIIVTGERRWRAAKQAGLKEVPCIIISLTGKERFKHQLHENIHHNTMNSYDTGAALFKVLKEYQLLSPGDSESRVAHNDKGISWLAVEFGKSRGYILEHIKSFEYANQSSKYLEGLKDGKIKQTAIRIINAVPDKFKKQIETKIIKKEFINRDAGLKVAEAIKNNPNKGEEILGKSYSGKTIYDIDEELKSYITSTDQLIKNSKIGDEIAKVSHRLTNLLHDIPISEVSPAYQLLVLRSLRKLQKDIDNYLTVEPTIKLIENV